MVVVVAAPHDDLLKRFVSDLKRRGLPPSRIADSASVTAATSSGNRNIEIAGIKDFDK